MSNVAHLLINLVVVDEATAAISRQRDKETPGGISSIVDCMINGRALGEGVICLVNSLSTISDIARQNFSACFLDSVAGENPWILRNTVGVTTEQIEQFRIQSAKPGHVICLNQELFDKPVYAVSSLLPIPGKCDQDMQQASLVDFMKKVKTLAPVPTSEFRARKLDQPVAVDQHIPQLPARSREFLVCIVTGIPKPVSKVKSQMNLNSVQLRRIAKRLESIGAIRPHRFSTGRVGGQLCFYEVKQYGWVILKAFQIIKTRSLTNGDFEHELAAQLIAAEGKRLGLSVQFEVDINGVRIDAVLTDRKNGRRRLYNIGISRPVHEVESLEKFLQLPIANSSQFVLVARDSSFAKKVKAILKSRDLQGEILHRIQIKLIADFVN